MAFDDSAPDVCRNGVDNGLCGDESCQRCVAIDIATTLATTLATALTPVPPPIPPRIAAYLRDLIDYNWDDEKADYDDNPDNAHVFVGLNALRAWLTDTEPTVPDIGDRFTHNRGHHTVTSWLKRHPAPTIASRNVGPDNCPLVFCPREEAEYVGFTGGILRVVDVQVTSRADWSDGAFAARRRSAALLYGHEVV